MGLYFMGPILIALSVGGIIIALRDLRKFKKKEALREAEERAAQA